MTQYAIRVTETLAYQVYATEFARDRRDIGPRFPTPREAIRYSDNLQAAVYVSPLRVSGVESTPLPGRPLPGDGQSDSTSEPSRDDSPDIEAG